MKCSNCQFFNMPGSAECGRCGSSLRLGGSNIGVMPPRAGRARKQLRQMLPIRRMYNRASEGFVAEAASRHLPTASKAVPWALAAVPGLPHFALGQPIRGHLFLWGVLLTLVAGFVFIGTTWGGILLGVAYSIHTSAVADIINQKAGVAALSGRMLRGICVSAALFAFVYWPAGRLIARVAAPYQLAMPLAPFEAGDVILARPVSHPRPGDVVMYDMPANVLINWYHHTTEYVAGRAIDRVLAGPGSTVEARDGRLYVDGTPSKFAPLNPARYTKDWKAVVPDRAVFVLPTNRIGDVDALNDWGRIGAVPVDRIIGRVYLRTYPWKRFGVIR